MRIRRAGFTGSAVSSLAATALLFGLVSPRIAAAAPNVRAQLDQTGDFILIGNTLGYECAAGTPAPIVGVANAAMCGANAADTAPDMFWRSDSPSAGEAEASTAITPATARSTAVLTLPVGATVTHAFLYWGARRSSAGSDATVTLDREGAFSADVTAVASAEQSGGGSFFYQSVANVTSIVQANGPGAYRVSGVDAADLADVNNASSFAGWSMVIFYRTDTDTLRNLALYDGLDLVATGSSIAQTISGFLVPASPSDGKLGLFVYEGDNSQNGDSVFFNGGGALSDGQNQSNNFFNGTRSYLGAAFSVAGDLPQLSGQAQSMGGVDIDVVNVKTKLTQGATSANVQFTTTNDSFYVGAFVTSIPTFRPDMATSTKIATDLSGGALLPGDTVEYTITVKNGGSDTSVLTTLIDPLPMGVTYVPGSLQIAQGQLMGPKTDVAGDDQGEYDGPNRIVTVRLGMNANQNQGGSLAVGESTVVKFLVTVDANAVGILLNQAQITAAGMGGAPAKSYSTDGNGPLPGSPPTPIGIDTCVSDNDCGGTTPFCDIPMTPNTCVECLSDADCGALKSTCDKTVGACVCNPLPAELCDAKDNTCDGTIDEGNPESGQACPTGLPGACAVGSTTCSNGALDCVMVVTPGMNAEVCGDMVDDDCDGALNNNCPDADADGLPDYLELTYGTDPNDKDTDDDGAWDGDELDPGADTDGDGLLNVLDADSDNDGLFDGTELGKGCADPDTDAAKGRCRADADPATTTDPLSADSDGGGASDGSEDPNLNGKKDAGELDPSAGGDDGSVADGDGDGVSDALEMFLGTSAADADSDDDGALDGAEANPSEDTDGDGLLNILDADSDNDALPDGLEAGFDCSNAGTDAKAERCHADTDPATKTSSLRADTDGGGYRDGSEDTNLNGAVDGGETDPNSAASEPTAASDFDGDGLTDGLELTIGTSQSDADSDDDGALDGDEPNPAIDDDGDGKITTLDGDSDGDGLTDGLELGKDCASPDTDPLAVPCVADGDLGATTTSALVADTDHGGASDASEDTNKNGVVDFGERDPNDGSDDKLMTCMKDGECGGPTSGMVCDANGLCSEGCRGTGNGCPDGQVCSSTDATIGTCGQGAGGGGGGGQGGSVADGPTSSSAASGSGGDGGSGLHLKGGGVLCAAAGAAGSTSDGDGSAGLMALAIAGAAAIARRRRSDSATK